MSTANLPSAAPASLEPDSLSKVAAFANQASVYKAHESMKRCCHVSHWKRTVMKKWTHMASLAVVLALGFALGSLSSDSQADSSDLRWVAGEFPEEFLRSMEESSAAFLRKDMEATRAHMTEDFATSRRIPVAKAASTQPSNSQVVS